MMDDKHILVVEDDKNIAKLVRYNIEKAGFTCEVKITGEDAIEYLKLNDVDLIIMDVMLPKIDGFEACKIIKKDEDMRDIPIVMLTAKGEEIDRIIGFEIGADDYIVKPFSPRELILRIKAILKRKSKTQVLRKVGKEVISIKDVTIDNVRHKVIVDSKEIKLTMMEFKLLQILMERKGRVQSREQLLEDVWAIQADVTTRTVDTHIKRLRQKLGKVSENIETIRGIGYCFKDN